MKKYLTKQQTNDENEEELKDPTIFNIKNICFYSINEKKIFNFDDYKNIIAFDENQSTSIEDLSEYYKALSSFCLWKNCLDEEFCIISTLSGGLIFLKLNDGNHVIFLPYIFKNFPTVFILQISFWYPRYHICCRDKRKLFNFKFRYWCLFMCSFGEV